VESGEWRVVSGEWWVEGGETRRNRCFLGTLIKQTSFTV
jgi:hypothetical protein